VAPVGMEALTGSTMGSRPTSVGPVGNVIAPAPGGQDGVRERFSRLWISCRERLETLHPVRFETLHASPSVGRRRAWVGAHRRRGAVNGERANVLPTGSPLQASDLRARQCAVAPTPAQLQTNSSLSVRPTACAARCSVSSWTLLFVGSKTRST
jgi:hypothetical protein